MEPTATPNSKDRVSEFEAPQPSRKAGAGLGSARPLAISTRTFLGNRFVYAVISQRAKGLSIGINLNPDRRCNFDCLYCEVLRDEPPQDSTVDVAVLRAELERMLNLVREGRVREFPNYQCLPEEVLELKEVALSGNGEPTLCPNFREVVQTVAHIRAKGDCPLYKIVLITNSSGLDRPEVRAGLQLLTPTDEIWAKLDAGTQAYLSRINRTSVPLQKILNNILSVARERPVVIQSLWPLVHGQEPPEEEVDAFVQRLVELKEAGAQISLVQIYSAHRPTLHQGVGHLPLRRLSQIAQKVRTGAGLPAEVF